MIKSPEFYFLSLDKDDGDSLTEKILFFGEAGEIKINTLLRTFASSAKIEGSENQLFGNEYNLLCEIQSKEPRRTMKHLLAEDSKSVEERAADLKKPTKYY